MEKTIDLEKIYGTKNGVLKCVCGDYPFNAHDEVYDWRRPAVILVPGGGYEFVSAREGAPIAYQFLARGFQTFVLKYSVKGDGVRYPEQLTELACAVDYIKNNADEFNVNPDEVFAVGFSAGGHLVADLAVEWKDIENITGKRLNCRPSAVGLAYSVITNKPGYTGTHDSLLNGYSEEQKSALLKKLNLDEAVDGDTVPAFIWTTCSDELVPSENSLLFALSLARNKIPYELHIYPDGCHGGASCDCEINFDSEVFRRAGNWLNDCAAFFRRFTIEKY